MLSFVKEPYQSYCKFFQGAKLNILSLNREKNFAKRYGTRLNFAQDYFKDCYREPACCNKQVFFLLQQNRSVIPLVVMRFAISVLTGTVNTGCPLLGARKSSSGAPRWYPRADTSWSLISGIQSAMTPPCHCGYISLIVFTQLQLFFNHAFYP